MYYEVRIFNLKGKIKIRCYDEYALDHQEEYQPSNNTSDWGFQKISIVKEQKSGEQTTIFLAQR